MIGTPSFVVVDVGAGTSLEERQRYAEAQQIQLQRDYAPRWGCSGTVRDAFPAPAAGEVQIRLLDKPTLAGAEGYHDCMPDGTPIAYIFVGLAKRYGQRWETIASHEVLEIMGDPLLRRAVETPQGFIDCEVCDRVEQEWYTITCLNGTGVPMSNFNYPECFEPPANLAGVKFDYMGTSKRPNEVRPGGYSQRFDPSKGWIQLGQMSAYRKELIEAGMSRGLRRASRYESSWWTRLLHRAARAAW